MDGPGNEKAPRARGAATPTELQSTWLDKKQPDATHAPRIAHVQDHRGRGPGPRAGGRGRDRHGATTARTADHLARRGRQKAEFPRKGPSLAHSAGYESSGERTKGRILADRFSRDDTLSQRPARAGERTAARCSRARPRSRCWTCLRRCGRKPARCPQPQPHCRYWARPGPLPVRDERAGPDASRPAGPALAACQEKPPCGIHRRHCHAELKLTRESVNPLMTLDRKY